MTDGVWFRAAIGKRKNAEARWLLPMICRRGGIDRQDIGAIRILDTTTEFEISQSAAEAFAAQIKRPDKDDNIRIEPLIGAKPLEPSTEKPAYKPHDGNKPDRDARRTSGPTRGRRSWTRRGEPRRDACSPTSRTAPARKSFHDERAPRAGKEAIFKEPSFKKDDLQERRLQEGRFQEAQIARRQAGLCQQGPPRRSVGPQRQLQEEGRRSFATDRCRST